eukprot:TRINITY_DN6676_c4_g1_i1.p1 TRINITY_DN6676_c4_g1~~TRINITY_DN6676_c4_g1_i1.p1  ORF type:complete len:388 (+),score=91.94 TRINITY_DN6676_c4_g1_i1:70-1233(+)
MARYAQPPWRRPGAAVSLGAAMLLVLWYYARLQAAAGGPAGGPSGVSREALGRAAAGSARRRSAAGAGAGGAAGAPLPSAEGLLYANGSAIPADGALRWAVQPISWFTVLNGPRYYWCDLLASAWHNRITMNIWGWGNAEFNDWLMTWMKLPLSREFAEGLPEDHLVGFVDGADSLFQLSSAEMLPAYERLAAGGSHPLVMSTEINCAVQSLPKHGCDNEVFPMTPHGRRHLNSGLWLGRAGFVRDFYQHVERHYLPQYRQGSVQRNDQSLVGRAFHDGWRRNVSLDAETALFQSVRKAEGHYCQPGQNDQQPPVPDAERGRLKNCLTGHIPGVFHFNGYAKPFLAKWIGHFWWYGRRIDPRAGVFVNRQPVALRALCPKLPFDEGG